VTAQPGIFALGTPEHCYLELDLLPGRAGEELVRAVAGASGPLSTTGGVNLVVGFRPELWEDVAPGQGPADAQGWSERLRGPDGFTMPATQHDAWLWISGGSRTAVFDAGKEAIAALRGVAQVASETNGWLYQHDRDLTGFIDGTENPSLLEAPDVVAAPPDSPGAGASVVLYQVWPHDAPRWDAEPVERQEAAMGRTKPDSVELDDDVKPADSHVSRTVVEVDGEELDIFRRNVAYGGVTAHGTVFVGFSHDQWRMAEMLRRMAGVGDGIRCALTRYTYPVSGAYYVVPSVEALHAFAPEPA
jgi:putative iron-dependent peroxidase